MTTHEAAEFIRKRVKLCPGGLTLWGAHLLTHATSRLFSVMLTTKLPHRDTGVPGPVVTEAALDTEMLAHFDERRLLYWLYHEVLLGFMRHELDESILVDGVRLFDPHPETRPAHHLAAMPKAA